MAEDVRERIPRTAEAAAGDDAQSAEEVRPHLDEELLLLARRRMSGLPPGSTLQPMGVVHEAYLRLALGVGRCTGRARFLGAAARAMRNTLIDRARAKGPRERGAPQGGVR
jgi:DNA-directed RNA polymerase specialized sigma24 family protein